MKRCLLSVFLWVKKQLWSLIVAYMLGMHNFYHGDTRTADDPANKIEANEAQENESP
ncbi:hypothetical protein WBG78_01185 [Chryseolinea sp. T2]|uniref:hypothetical protein n=1 Tax=Chryseolinea sp. T2 TaxID=3129255 RepID=UPI0030779AEE